MRIEYCWNIICKCFINLESFQWNSLLDVILQFNSMFSTHRGFDYAGGQAFSLPDSFN